MGMSHACDPKVPFEDRDSRSPQGDIGVQSSVLESLTLLSLARQKRPWARSVVRADEFVPTSGHTRRIAIRLPSDSLRDELREGALVARSVHDDLAPFCGDLRVRVSFL